MNIKPIKSDDDLTAALKRIDEIIDAKPETKEHDELLVLSVLVENYEDEHYPFEEPDPIRYIEFRMEQLGLKRKDVIELFGGFNRITEVLKKDRKLTINMINKIHDRLKIPYSVLLSQ